MFHVSLLKKWETAIAKCNLGKEVEEEEEGFLDWKESKTDEVTIEKELTSEQRESWLQQVLEEFKDVLQGKPGRTNMAVHSINTDAKPVRVRLPPYRIPHVYKEAVETELKEMEESGIIEPSTSERASL